MSRAMAEDSDGPAGSGRIQQEPNQVGYGQGQEPAATEVKCFIDIGGQIRQGLADTACNALD